MTKMLNGSIYIYTILFLKAVTLQIKHAKLLNTRIINMVLKHIVSCNTALQAIWMLCIESEGQSVI